MRLDAIAVELRPRNAWEATDLGAAMVRRWPGPVYAAWFALAAPLFLLLHLICWNRWWLVPWLLWWLKPLLDRPLLYVLGHVLFGETPDRRQVRRDWPGLLRRQAFAALTWRRFDAARAFTLPVDQLEGRAGQARRQRLRDLSRSGRGPAVWLTVVCLHLEIALDFALIALVWMLLPDFVTVEFSDLLDDADVLGQLWLNAIGFCGLSLVEPFYVAAGFALYLNRRVWLEAWDLELGFRRLAARLARSGRAAAGVLLALGLGLLAIPATGFTADAPPRAAPSAPAEKAPPIKSPCQQRREREAQLARAASPVKQALAETLREPELRICAQRDRWRWRDDDASDAPDHQPPDRTLAQRFAAAVEILLWFALGVFVVLAGWEGLRRAPGALVRAGRRRAAAPATPPVRGRNDAASPTTGLGDDAWRLWVQGQPRQALKLLYRGSLTGLATQYALPVQTSATEEECLRLVAARLADPGLLDFFHRLTRAWQATAYAHRPPDPASARALCEEWPRYFAAGGAWPA